WRMSEDDPVVFERITAMQATGSEPSQIRRVRANSNYITPKLGLFSADTWSVLAIYVRNLILNWLMFLPLLIGCLLIPPWYVAVLKWAHSGNLHPGWPLIVGAALLTFALACAVWGRFRSRDKWVTQTRFLSLVLLPIVLSAAAFTFAAALGGLHAVLGGHHHNLTEQYIVGAMLGVFLYAIAWLIGRIGAWRWDEKIIAWDLFCWILSGCVVGLIIAWGMHLAAAARTFNPALIAILGLSGVVLAYLAGDIFYVGASSYSRRGEMDREWLARASGWLAAVAVIWALVSVLSIFGSRLSAGLESVDTSFRALWTFVIGGGLSGLVTLVAGPHAGSAATRAGTALERIPLTRIASVAAVIFAAILGVGIAWLGRGLLGLLAGCDSEIAVDEEAAVILALIGLSFGISYFVNVNRFSMHALYRNRLVRAFLGSARRPGNRDPDPFTRFDAMDNPRLAAVTPRSGPDRLFHVINTTLNVVATTNTAWAERKAESFTMTRQHCGNSFVGYQATADYGDPRGGITLGTAMAISGAAVSPNQGYNSSPLVGFLLMLFNVRLGWWLGNPHFEKFNREGPLFGIVPALKELAGLTTDRGPWIYLSDGGHFDNLGLYEMIRRRCRFIVAIDSGCDPECKLEDLGNAVRKIYIDFGVSIEFAKFEIRARPKPQPCPPPGRPVVGARFATASITYPKTARDGPEPRTGWLLYIKPTYYETTEGVDVRGYASLHPSFPHESTTDQWFSESQLEAYRALAEHIVEDVCCPHGKTREALKLRSLREAVERHTGHREAAEHRR
ncbi:MAG TPA: hypothetical protein VM713_00970, partial [Steroidobacteraceae bacterium]|nr:hypothetical protein [Steroidobacteraceae bacterium]